MALLVWFFDNQKDLLIPQNNVLIEPYLNKLGEGQWLFVQPFATEAHFYT